MASFTGGSGGGGGRGGIDKKSQTPAQRRRAKAMSDYWQYGPKQRKGETDAAYNKRLGKWAARKSGGSSLSSLPF